MRRIVVIVCAKTLEREREKEKKIGKEEGKIRKRRKKREVEGKRNLTSTKGASFHINIKPNYHHLEKREEREGRGREREGGSVKSYLSCVGVFVYCFYLYCDCFVCDRESV